MFLLLISGLMKEGKLLTYALKTPVIMTSQPARGLEGIFRAIWSHLPTMGRSSILSTTWVVLFLSMAAQR